ncbi:MAG: GTPase HflX [Acidobacteria bacterium]|nr:GTPase HflX [Acidobacteriota bacterium]MCZ6878789.1 GTPase HflX [Acidobacteriota bacterium]
MEATSPRPERAVLVGVCRDARQRSFEKESLRELEELAASAGAQVSEVFLQEKSKPDPSYLVGRGKLEEIQNSVLSCQADLVIFNEDLTPAQLRHLEGFLETKIIDRSELILDIFTQRAQSREGKLQVELAQMEYWLPRLTGAGLTLSRLGGGIGTRGPGETKLEVDRRTIRVRISRLKRELQRLEARRALQRRKRQGVPIPTISLVGYTNAGKSTLFNALTDQKTYVSQRMFATLDPLVRKMVLDSGQKTLLSDTVGFIRKLPHTLVAAFHATLEETLEADLILHVIDVSHPNYEALREAVYEVLDEIGLEGTPILEAFNKIDLLEQVPHVETSLEHAFISARSKEGLPRLLQRIEFLINRNYREVHLTIPLHRGDLVAKLRERANICSQEYREDGIHLRASLPLADLGRYRQFVDDN